MNDDRAGGHVVRDMERFKLLFTNSKAEIDDEAEICLGATTTRALIGRRIRELKAKQASA